MHEILNSFKQKPIPKFQQSLINFEKPQNFSKTPKPRFQNMKCMKNERLEAYQVKKLLKKLKNPLGKRLGVSERGLGGEKIEVSRERSREMRFGWHEEVYIKPQ